MTDEQKPAGLGVAWSAVLGFMGLAPYAKEVKTQPLSGLGLKLTREEHEQEHN